MKIKKTLSELIRLISNKKKAVLAQVEDDYIFIIRAKNRKQMQEKMINSLYHLPKKFPKKNNND